MKNILLTLCSITVISLSGYNTYSATVALTINNASKDIATVEKLTNQSIIAASDIEVNPKQVSRDTVGKITGSVKQTLSTAFKTVPEVHRKRLIEDILPAIYVLCDSEVVNVVGEIVSIQILWGFISQEYISSTSRMIGTKKFERFRCIIRLKNLGLALDKEWLASVSFTTSNYDFVTTEVYGADLLELVFDQLSQSLLAKIAMENEDYYVRKGAVTKLTDKSLLVKLVMEDKDSDIRKAAVKNLTDQSVLVKLVMEDKDSDIRKTAVKNLTDQSVLEKIALEDEMQSVRQAAAEKLTNQSLLGEIAMEDEDSDVRGAAVKNLTDQSLLGKIALEDENWFVRYSAIKNLTDQSILGKIALEDEDWRIRYDAVKKLTDQSILEGIALQDEDSRVRYAAKIRLDELR